MLDLLLKNAKFDTSEATFDIALRNGVIDTIASNITEVAQTVFGASHGWVAIGTLVYLSSGKQLTALAAAGIWCF